MSRDSNFSKVVDEAYGDDEFAKKCEHVVHGFMHFLTEVTGAESGELTSTVQRDHTTVVDGDFVHTRQYRARVVVKGPNGEEWSLQVAATPDRGS